MPVQEDEEQAEETSCTSEDKDFGIYQLLLFIVTQLGYFPVAASMLVTTFFEPSQNWCRHSQFFNNQSSTEKPKLEVSTEFASLLVEWGEECRQSSFQLYVSSSIMCGAVFGAFACGFFADRCGRKPIVVGTMSVLCICNALLVFFAAEFRYLSLVLFFLLGCASGGYMVTNMVLMIEALDNSRSRLLVTSLNGWPLGMVYTAIVGFFTLEWKMFHFIISATAAVSVFVLHFFSLESVRWLIGRNKMVRAGKVQNTINTRNFRSRPHSPSKEFVQNNLEKNNLAGDKNRLDVLFDGRQESPASSVEERSLTRPNNYTYLDLFRHADIAVPLVALLYCFASSSVVSFGFYFTVETFPGNRYFNIAIMGAGKFILGLLPFAASFYVGRRPIIMASLSVACVGSWMIIGSQVFTGPSAMLTVLGLTVTAAMDPAWKIIHLYSVELFPTAVRNMARGMCNVVARFGSLSGPWVAYLHSRHALLPFWIFALLLTGQCIVAFIGLPETQNKPLPEQMPSDISASKNESRATNDEQLKERLVGNC